MITLIFYGDHIILHPATTTAKYSKPFPLWDGKYSSCKLKGSIMNYISTHIMAKLPEPARSKTLFLVFQSDGDVSQSDVATALLHAKIPPADYDIIVGTLAQTNPSYVKDAVIPPHKMVFLPLDDAIFSRGIAKSFPSFRQLPLWTHRKNTIFWRGGNSRNIHIGDPSLRYQVVERLFAYPDTDCKLIRQWDRGYENPTFYDVRGRVDPSEFSKYKTFLIIDGNCIASNHMWGFAIGCVPVIISRARCWFQELLKDKVNCLMVNPDLSDLETTIEWIRNHDDEAKVIAVRAHAFAMRVFSASFQQMYLKKSIHNEIARSPLTASIPAIIS